MKSTNGAWRSKRQSPAAAELLKQMKVAVISRYGSLSEGARALGISRWGLRRAVLGRSSNALRKMEDAGLVAPQKRPAIKRDSVAVNSACGYGELLITACNTALSGQDFEFLSPWGDHPNPAGLQRLTLASGLTMASALNAKRSQEGAAFRGAPIYIGHPDVDPVRYKDDRRIGRVDSIVARPDGLYVSIAYNDLGQKNEQEGYYVYPSAAWRFKRLPGGVIEPTELVSVGLTNTPNISGVKPWTANSIVESTTPGAAKREAKQLLKEYTNQKENYSALTAIAQRQAQLQREKNMPEHQALLQAQIDLPESAAAAAGHLQNLDAVRKKNERRKSLKEFIDAVHARMDREGGSYASAWAREKIDRKKKNEWTPDNE